MSILTQKLGNTGYTRFTSPRRIVRRLLGWLLDHDALARERHAMAELDARTLQDIGVDRSDVTRALNHPDEHLRSIRLLGGDQLLH